MQLILAFDEFDTFYKFINKIRTIKVNEENQKLSKCNCCYWLKNYVCIHVIIIAVYFKKDIFPDQSKNIQIPHNTKRGRKPKTKKALNKQNILNPLVHLNQ